MEQLELIGLCHFGLEAVLKKEILDLGYEIASVEDGRVNFLADAAGIARANIFIRTAERIMIKIGSFRAVTFDELFEAVKALPWERYIPENGRFWVTKATTKNSRLFSSSDIQSIVKKAIVERMKQRYRLTWFAEDGDDFPVRIFIHKDIVTVALDTSGVSLHKRGYRRLTAKAPISETLAAALIMLTPWNRDRILVDPFCGSGTFPIEAALIGAGIAPGMHREFTAMKWTGIVPEQAWQEALREASDLVKADVKLQIQGYDADGAVVKCAMANAQAAGVKQHIHFQQRDVKDLRHPKKYGFIITNPPYGERLEEQQALPALYTLMGESFRGLDSWSWYVITSYADAEKYIGRKADKNRKIYNGMIKAYYYQFMGPKPPKKPRAENA